MSDGELSAALKKHEKTQLLCTILTALSVVGGIAVGILSHDIRYGLLVFFVFIAAAALIGSASAKKRRELIHAQLGDFFVTEFGKAFSEDTVSDGYAIDEKSVRASGIFGEPFETCEIKNLHGGICGSKKFSAANVTLTHSFDEFPGREDSMVRTVRVLDGLFLIYESEAALQSDVVLRAKPSKNGEQFTSLDARFETVSGDSADIRRVFTEALRTLCDELCGAPAPLLGAGSSISGIAFSDGRLILAVNTAYAFADVPEANAVSSADEARAYYTSSLECMKTLCGKLGAYTASISS